MEEEKILVFDSSILLRMYRHSYEDIEKLLKDLEKEKKKIWIPNQTYIEFKENKESQKLNNLAIGQYKKAMHDLENIIKESQEKIKTQIEVYKGRKFPKIRSFEDEIKEQYNTFKPLMKKYKDIYKKHTDESRELHKTDPINSLVERLQSNKQVGKRYSISELLTIYDEAERRYTYKLPPGYMDDLRYNEKDGKKGVEKYGDYLIWKQMVKKASEENKNVLFVTEDQKEDWLDKGSLREDLVEEFKELTNGKNIKRLSFKELLEEQLDIKLKPSLKLELFPENYIDKDKIKNTIKSAIKQNLDIPGLDNYLEAIADFEELILEDSKIDSVEKIDNIKDIQFEYREDNEIFYNLNFRVSAIFLLNNFYKVELDFILFTSICFEITNNGDDFKLVYKENELINTDFICYITPDDLNVCPNCKINEAIIEYRPGQLLCEECHMSFTY